jgi:hypothetical protein
MDKKDGSRMRREFTLQGNAVRFAREEPCEQPAAPLQVKDPAPLPVVEAPTQPARPGIWDEVKRRWHAIRGK